MAKFLVLIDGNECCDYGIGGDYRVFTIDADSLSEIQKEVTRVLQESEDLGEYEGDTTEEVAYWATATNEAEVADIRIYEIGASWKLPLEQLRDMARGRREEEEACEERERELALLAELKAKYDGATAPDAKVRAEDVEPVYASCGTCVAGPFRVGR